MKINSIISFVFCFTLSILSTHAQNSLEVTAFEDMDGNGSQDTGEPTIDGITTTELRLWQDVNDNGVVDGGDVEFMHDGGIAGVYTFGTGNILPDDNYIIEYFENGGPDSYFVTELTNGVGSSDMDNDFDPISNSAGFALLNDTPETLIDLGLVISGNIGDQVWHDLNGDGIQDVGEPGLDDVMITLLDASTLTSITQDIDFFPLANPTITAFGGLYSFDHLPPGEYIVEFDVPPPSPDLWYPTEFSDHSDDTDPTNDSDANNDPFSASYLQSHVIVLLSDEMDEEEKIDAGFVQAPSNDNCSSNNPDILLATSGTTSYADYDVNTCDINDPSNDHQVFYEYVNLTGSNVDLEITLDPNSANGNPASQVSITALQDNCSVFIGFYNGELSNSEWCEVLGSGTQILPCIENGESVFLVFSSEEGQEGDFLISATENLIQPINNNDECEDAFDITPFETCLWETIGVNNENACPEDFSTVGGCLYDTDPTVWYSFTVPPEQGNFAIEIQNVIDAGSYLSVFEFPFDCDFPSPIVNFECVSGSLPTFLSDPLIPGATYLIAFANPVPGDYSFDMRIIKFPDNDECLNAETLSPNISALGTTLCATQEIIPYNSNVCSDFDETNTVWYEYSVSPSDKGFHLSIIETGIIPLMGQINVVVFETTTTGCVADGTTFMDEECMTSGVISEEFECIGEGTYLIRVSTSDNNAGDFEILVNPLALEQPNDNCNSPDVAAFGAALNNEWMNTTATTFGACPSETFDPSDCLLDEFPVVWYEATSPESATALDLMIISSTAGTPFISVFFSTIDCSFLQNVTSTPCYTGTFLDLESLGESLIDVNSSTTYLIAVGSEDPSGGEIEFGIKWISPSDECPGGGFPGDPCDDDDDCTIDDTLDEDCDCVGIFQDSDGDGTCDADDICANNPEPGDSCDDNDDCTTNDVIDGDCNCVGVFEDSDGDGVCDAEDICADGPEPGMACDDEEDCTIDDVIDDNCNCEGTFQDSDSDEICDAEDICADGPDPGLPCDDNDACTINDVIDDDCNCAGTFQDSDGDGVCDADDLCPGSPEPGSACDDEDECTINDTVDEDCNCIGEFQDSDGDGTCDTEDVCDNGPEPGTACDDENDCTVDDIINEDCFCVGTFLDSDFDGVCDAEDVCPGGPEPGMVCDDNDVCTINDTINVECICVGTFVDNDNDGVCDAEDICEDGPEPGMACDDGDECTTEDTINEECGCIGIFQDSDQDGTCDAEDVCEDGPEPGTACDDGDENTFNDQITSDCICVGSTDTLYCPGLDLNIGDNCDDGDECTINDLVDENCNCVGEYVDSDGDGTCDANDLCPDGPEPGTPCDDESIETINDQINLDCECEGEIDSTYCVDLGLYIGDYCDDNDTCTVNDMVDINCNCLGTFQDSDGDGVCDANDVCPDGPEPGTPCDDMNPNTTNDQINENCECIGSTLADYCIELDLFIGDPCDDNDPCTVMDTVSVDCECVGEFEDSDGDTVCDAQDNCPGFANQDQADNDEDGFGDVCDEDDDNDTIPDTEDNCPFTPNPDQADEDMDGLGDVCDVVSTENLNIAQNLLYPNPTTGQLFIDSKYNLHYRIFNTQGKLILKSTSKTKIIDIIQLESGLYFIELYDENNSLGFARILKL
ncbi:MAG: SdrD B-like domain-containing protein [Bacteroidota bacterium]